MKEKELDWLGNNEESIKEVNSGDINQT